MEYKANEIKAGLLIVGSVAILVLFLVAIFGVHFGKNTKNYTTYLKNIPGITEGSLVKYGGMDVGFVTDISLPESGEPRIGLNLQVDVKTPVRVDSKAFVTSIGIMADQHIEISAGSADADFLSAGSVIEGKEVLGFPQMAEPLGELNSQLQELLVRVSNIFNDENQAHLSSMVTNLDSLIIEGQGQFLRLGSNVEGLTANLADLSSDLNALMDNNKDHLNETLEHLQEITEETRRLISDLHHTLTVFDKMLSVNSTSFVEIMENFQFASQNLEEFTRIVKERPWLLVRKAAPPKRKLP